MLIHFGSSAARCTPFLFTAKAAVAALAVLFSVVALVAPSFDILL